MTLPLVSVLRANALDLETICPVCGGSGKGNGLKNEPICLRCEGRCLVLTDLGKAILDLVKEHFYVSPRDSAKPAAAREAS